MPVRIGSIASSLRINADKGDYEVMDLKGVSRGDLLHIVGRGVTGNTEIASIDAIALSNGAKGDIVKCYILSYQSTYGDIDNLVPYVILEQFTYKDISTKIIPNNISTACDSVSTQSCDMISKYFCDTLNTYGSSKNSAITLLIPKSGWSSSAPYQNKVYSEQIRETASPVIALKTTGSDTADQIRNMQTQWNDYVDAAFAYDGYITFIANNTKPTVDIRVTAKGVS